MRVRVSGDYWLAVGCFLAFMLAPTFARAVLEFFGLSESEAQVGAWILLVGGPIAVVVRADLRPYEQYLPCECGCRCLKRAKAVSTYPPEKEENPCTSRGFSEWAIRASIP